MNDVPQREARARSDPGSRALGPRVLSATLILQFVFGLVYVWGALVPYVRLTTHWAPWMIGAVWSTVPVGFGLGMIGAGRLADTYPARALCWSAVGLMALGFAIAFLLPGWVTITVFYSGVGLGVGAALALAGSISAATYFYPRHVGTVGGALTGIYAFSALILIPVVSRLAAAVGWLDALRGVGVGVILLGIIGMAIMPTVPRPQGRGEAVRIAAMLTLLVRTSVWTGFLLEALSVVFGAAAVVNIGAYALDLHSSFSAATAAVTIVAVGNGVGRVGAGRASDLFGVHRVMLVILLCNLAAACILWRASGPVSILFAAALAGIGLGGPAGIVSRLAAEAAGDAPHSALGLLVAGYSAGSFSGPLLMAAIGLAGRGWMVLAGFPLAGLGVLAYRALSRRGGESFCGPDGEAG